jgi:streptogramin lyase
MTTMPDLHDLLERRAARYEPAPDGLERLRERAARRGRTRRVSAAVVAFSLVAVAGFGLWRAFDQVTAPKPVATSPIPTFSGRPTMASSVEATIRVRAFFPRIVGGIGKYLWYWAGDDQSLGRIDPTTDRPVGPRLYCSMTVPVGAFGSVWAAGDNGTGCMPGSRSERRIWRIDPETGGIVDQINIAGQTIVGSNYIQNVTAGEGAIWLSTWSEIGTGDGFQGTPGIIARIDPATNRVTGQTQVSKGDLYLAAGEGALWVAESLSSGRHAATLLRIDPGSLKVETRITLGRGVTGLGVGFGYVWAANSRDGTIMRIDPKTNSVTATTSVPDGVLNVIVAPDGIWTTAPEELSRTIGVVTRIDATTGQITGRIEIPTPQGVQVAYVQTYAFGSLWANAEPHTILRIDPGG